MKLNLAPVQSPSYCKAKLSLAPSGEHSGQNQRNPHPTHRNLKMDVASGCRIPFQKPAFVFLASVITNLYSSIWAGFQLQPYGGLGREKEGLAPGMCLYFKGAGADGRGLSLSCATFSSECHIGCWQPLCNTLSHPSMHPKLI